MSAGPVPHLTGQRPKLTFQTSYRWYVDLSVGLWSFVLFRECRTIVLCFFRLSHFFAVICSCARENDKGKRPHVDVPVSPYPWVDAMALTRWLLLLARRTI